MTKRRFATYQQLLIQAGPYPLSVIPHDGGRADLPESEKDTLNMKKTSSDISHNFSRARSRMPLWAQLVVMLTFVTTVLLSFILVRDYQNNRRSIIERQISTSGRLLDLELQNLDQYVKELTSFCLQPLYDSDFSRILSEKDPIAASDETYILNQMRTYFFSRSDLNGYQICRLADGSIYGRSGQVQHFRKLSDGTTFPEEAVTASSEGKYFHAILPSEQKNGFFDYYQSIIRIKNKQPAAVIRLEIDRSFASALNQSHAANGEFLCILNQNGQLLFSGSELLDEIDSDTLKKISGIASAQSASLEIGGKKWLCISCLDDRFGMQLVSFCPMQQIDTQISFILKSSLLLGMVTWLLAALATFVIVRLTTAPLTAFSRRMKEVGNGNFSPIEENGGSRELLALSRSFNEMVSHIDELINQNYVSEINEKTARLAALEAQLNPHFLYNTLQAIGTEALLNDQPQINRMLASLAANLRYSIKSGDPVRLKDEIVYVNNYIMLQKMRFEERLHVQIEISDEYDNFLIPKISIQTLVENSILHGFGDTTESISIRIHASRKNELLQIQVKDDGCGIDEAHLQELKSEFQNYLTPGHIGKIGLANLYSRLQILYQGKASLEIESSPHHGTAVTLLLPATTVLTEIPH